MLTKIKVSLLVSLALVPQGLVSREFINADDIAVSKQTQCAKIVRQKLKDVCVDTSAFHYLSNVRCNTAPTQIHELNALLRTKDLNAFMTAYEKTSRLNPLSWINFSANISVPIAVAQRIMELGQDSYNEKSLRYTTSKIIDNCYMNAFYEEKRKAIENAAQGIACLPKIREATQQILDQVYSLLESKNFEAFQKFKNAGKANIKDQTLKLLTGHATQALLSQENYGDLLEQEQKILDDQIALAELQHFSLQKYQELLDEKFNGKQIAPEIARAILPALTQTHFLYETNLNKLLHFIESEQNNLILKPVIHEIEAVLNSRYKNIMDLFHRYLELKNNMQQEALKGSIGLATEQTLSNPPALATTPESNETLRNDELVLGANLNNTIEMTTDDGEVIDPNFHVTLTDYTWPDVLRRIYDAAKESYDGSKGNESADAIERLVQRLVDWGHTSPMEMVKLTFQIDAPLFVYRQVLRHRTAILTRAELLPNYYTPEVRAKKGDFTKEEKERAQKLLDAKFQEVYAAHKKLHWHDADSQKFAGLFGQYVRFNWQMDLNNLRKFLAQRTASGAQYETRQLAKVLQSFYDAILPQPHPSRLELIVRKVADICDNLSQKLPNPFSKFFASLHNLLVDEADHPKKFSPTEELKDVSFLQKLEEGIDALLDNKDI